ncbi:12895_t:CDS:2 [Cetraspora pellucida]|uniref:12895_t:CDS:1 n=1 Tax=Cetraspora pellucida TaxID=1433469 RepID=A0A9N9G7H4_9GLOM|nr:12895_t:CDS:2 [Cetraspora pellucida]
MSATSETELIELMNSIVIFDHIENSYMNLEDVELDDSSDNTRESASNMDIIEKNAVKPSMPELSDTNIRIKSEDIPIDIAFNSWNEVETFFLEYDARNSFAVNKYRKKSSKTGIVKNTTFCCEFYGIYKPKKSLAAVQNGTQCNTKTKKKNCPWHCNLSLGQTGLQTQITTLDNRHNHILVPETQKFGSKYRKFYECRNSLCATLFKKRWKNLLKNYPVANDYLLRALYPNHRSWVCAYLYRVFTADIQSTSRVEGYNWIIKKELVTNSTLCELANHLDQWLKNEIQ